MRYEKFEGIAVFPKKVAATDVVRVGVWVRRDITLGQRELLLGLNAVHTPGHTGVRSGTGGTAVMYLGRLGSTNAARRKAESLMRAIEGMLDVALVLRGLRDDAEVLRALRV